MSRRLVKDTLRVALDLASGVTRLLPRPPAIRLLNYHEVLEKDGDIPNPYNQVSARALAGHIDRLLQEGFHLATVSEAARALDAGELPARTVGLTFDDGLAEHAEVVLPILRERRVRATFYILAGALGQPSGLGRKGEHLSKNGLRALAEAGMEIGSHSTTHPVLARLDAGDLEREVSGSRDLLGGILGIAPATFGYPYGSRRTFDDRVVDAVRRAGYTNAVCTVIGSNDPSTPRFELRRIPVYGTDRAETVLARAKGAYDWVGGVQEAWLRLFPHHSTRRNGS